MTRRADLVASIMFFSILCSAQEPVDGPIETLKARSRIVVVDVVATDSKGNPVKGLTAADFQLLEDKTPQKIRHFDEHTAGAQDAPAMPKIKMAPNTFTNVLVAPQGSALNVILLDALNTPQEFQPSIRSQLEKLANALPPNTRTAIFGLSGPLVMLQSFTSDPAVLKAILTQRRKMPSASTLQPTSAGVNQSASEQLMATADGTYEVAPYNPGSAISVFNRRIEKAQNDERVRMTLAALTEIGQYLAAMPGRKNLIWISGVFPLNFIPDVDSAEGGGRVFDNAADYGEEVAKVSSDLAHSQVAIYPVDGRGVQTDAAFAAGLPSRGRGALQNDPGYIGRLSSTLASTEISEHATMNKLAEETGGHAFFGSNDIAGLVTKAMEQGANYYTLTYIPTNPKWDGKPRKIKVMVEGKKLNLTYRSGYIAVDRMVTAANQQTTPETERTKASTVIATMRRGAPTPTEILFKILVTASSVIMPPTMTDDPKAQEKLAKVSVRPQRRYRVDYAVNPEDIQWTMDHGLRGANVDFMVMGYDGEGNLINKAIRSLPLKLTEADYAAAQRGGLQLAQEIAMPAKGEYYLRVGVLDKATNHIGSVEVSTSTLLVPKS